VLRSVHTLLVSCCLFLLAFCCLQVKDALHRLTGNRASGYQPSLDSLEDGTALQVRLYNNTLP